MGTRYLKIPIDSRDEIVQSLIGIRGLALCTNDYKTVTSTVRIYSYSLPSKRMYIEFNARRPSSKLRLYTIKEFLEEGF